MVRNAERLVASGDAAVWAELCNSGARAVFSQGPQFRSALLRVLIARPVSPMKNDLRFALRMIVAHRWFSLAIIVTLALGIGINTTVFTLVNAVLFKPVPVPGGDRLVTINNYSLKKPDNRSGISYLDFLVYREQSHTFEGLEAARNDQAVISDSEHPPERFSGMRVTTGLFTLLRTPPILGRGFTPDDGKAGAPVVVLLGYSVWQNRYAGAVDIVGRTVRLNGEPATIIGVMPANFRFPTREDIWFPLVPNAELEKRSNRPLQLFGLYKASSSIGEARNEIAVISGRLAAEFPDTNKEFGALVRTFHETYSGGKIRTVFLMMFGAVGFVLLIACANVANMMLSRALARARELSVRSALGASRWQLVRQLLVESVLLSVLGGILGMGLAAAGVHAFDLATRDVGKPYWILFEMDFVVFAYFAVVSVLTGIAFGLLPALRVSRVDLNTVLKDGAPSGGSARGSKLTATLVVLQFALTVVLLAGAGVMVRSFFAAQTLNPFVHAENVFTFRLQPPEAKGERYADPATRRQFYEQLLARLATIPGVTQVAAGANLPGIDGARQRDIEIEEHPNADPKQPARASTMVQTTNYLPTIGLPILTGRGFAETDGDTGKEAAVVTRTFAAKYWPGENAVGKRLRFIEKDKPPRWMTVVGVCGDIVQSINQPDAPPLMYLTHHQEPWSSMAVLLRTPGDPGALARPVREVVRALDQDLPLFELRPLAVAMERQRWFLAVFGTLFFAFALTALLMASVGIYAVVAQSTVRRTREIGIRMALGATAAGIMGLVLSRGLRQLAVGLVIGLAGAFAFTRMFKQVGFLVEVSPNDPRVFVSITALLIGIGVFACWLPARRAARILPTEALRTD